MNNGIFGKLLGASAALALAAPVMMFPASAFAWSGQASSGWGTTYGYGRSTPVHPNGSTYEDYYGYPPPPAISGAGASSANWNYSGASTPSYNHRYRSYYGSSEPMRAGDYVVSAGALNLRMGPSDAAPVRTVLPGGTAVRMAGPDVHGWYRVESPYGVGWVYSAYLSPG